MRSRGARDVGIIVAVLAAGLILLLLSMYSYLFFGFHAERRRNYLREKRKQMNNSK